MTDEPMTDEKKVETSPEKMTDAQLKSTPLKDSNSISITKEALKRSA